MKKTFRQKFWEEKDSPSINYYDVLRKWKTHQHRKVKHRWMKTYSRKKRKLSAIRLKNDMRDPNWIPF